jgi:molecular chaperone DnaJ
MENYYEILGVRPNAPIDDIKRAYRKLASRTHPDKDTSPDAAARFRTIQEAYDTLKDESKRRLYDAKTIPAKNTMGEDLKVSIKIKIQDIIQEKTKVIVIKRKGLCKYCEGTGSTLKLRKKCICCNGTGLRGLNLLLGQKKKCMYCKGLGSIVEGSNCIECKGEGTVAETLQHSLKLSLLNEIIVLPNQGNYSLGNKEPGDLIILLDIEQDPYYNVHGLNISGKIDISPAQAILGDTLTLQIFGKNKPVKIPPGSKQNFLAIGEGLCYEGKTGQLRLKINIVYPIALSEREKQLYQEILNIERTEIWPKILTI